MGSFSFQSLRRFKIFFFFFFRDFELDSINPSSHVDFMRFNIFRVFSLLPK